MYAAPIMRGSTLDFIVVAATLFAGVRTVPQGQEWIVERLEAAKREAEDWSRHRHRPSIKDRLPYEGSWAKGKGQPSVMITYQNPAS